MRVPLPRVRKYKVHYIYRFSLAGRYPFRHLGCIDFDFSATGVAFRSVQ